MKATAVKGSPRKGWNTDLLLQEALKGVAISLFFSLTIGFGLASWEQAPF